VALEVYYDARHAWNVRTMLDTAKKGLELYGREFGPYALPYYRIAEYARYRSNVQAGVGTIAYSEGSGFMTDLRGSADLDYATLHELAHQWWGNVYGARMQGRQLLNEGLAQYSTLMAYRTYAPSAVTRRLFAGLHRGYLDARSNETRDEQPIVKTEDQGYISYNKAPLALFALESAIGPDAVNGALRAYYTRFVDKPAPFPTSRDLIDELRHAAGDEYQGLITDLFERITLYDSGVTAATVRPVGDEFDVTMDLTGRQFDATGNGDEREVPLDTWFQIAVFPQSDRDVSELEPLYLARHKLRSGPQRITVRVPRRPGSVGVDPFHLMIDRQRDNNLFQLARN
jgi:ABC-2 type transport system permease protein